MPHLPAMSSISRTALVTGASKGVGRGIALGLARAGWDVAINYHHDEAGALDTAEAVTALGRRSLTGAADVGDHSQMEAMVARVVAELGRLDLMVNNAGRQTWAPLLDLEEADWDRTLRTNLKGTFLGTQAAGRVMRDQGEGGVIINIGSGANKSPFPNLADYCASKGGIDALTRVAAVELGPHGIRVNCVAPGAIEIERTQLESPDYAGTWGAITPLGRVGVPADIAAVVTFLASPEADFTTGQTVYVDGGLWTKAQWPYQG